MNQSAPVVAGYEILGELGRGTTGIVYNARHPIVDRLVALKTPLPIAEARSGEQRERFLREARALAYLTGVSGSNIAAVCEVSEDQGRLFLTREFVEGQTLERLVLRRSLGLRAGLAILGTVARVVQGVHDKGIVHRNLLPSNILVGLDWTPWLIGFGRVSLAGFEGNLSGGSVQVDLQRLTRILAWLCSRRRPVSAHLEALCQNSSIPSAAAFANQLSRCLG